MLQVAINIEDDAWQGITADIEQACQAVLAESWQLLENQGIDLPPVAWVSVQLAGDDRLHQLNRDFRGKDKPTNVLSFPSAAQPQGQGDAPAPLGDLALSVQTVQCEATDQGKPVDQHLAHLLMHGLLHLLGYDHENDADAAVMERLEIDMLAAMQIPNPYEQPRSEA